MARPPKYPFQAEYTFLIYDMVKSRNTRRQIAERLGIPFEVFQNWTRDNPAVRMAMKYGKLRRQEQNTTKEEFEEFIAGRISAELRPMWDRMRAAHKNKQAIPLQIQQASKEERQILFLQALFRFNFSTTKAKHFAGVADSTLKHWMSTPNFRKLHDQLLQAKKDFFEEALIYAVKRNETAAIIFANKTMNRDRGYGDSKEVKISGEMNHKHEHTMLIDLDSLNLPLEIQAVIAEAMEKRKKFLDEQASKNMNVIEMKPVMEEVV